MGDGAKPASPRVAELIGLDGSMLNVLSECKKAVTVSIPTRMDDGSVQVFEGYRVTQTSRAGPRRAASATTPPSPSGRRRRSPCG